MTWTTNKPKEPGWYWLRWQKGQPTHIAVEVSCADGSTDLFVVRQFETIPVNDIDGEWQGPIVPQESER